MAGSPHRDSKSRKRVIGPAKGRAVAADAAPDQRIERDWPRALHDEPGEQNCPEEMLIRSLARELDNQGQDQHRQRREARRQTHRQQWRADELDRRYQPRRRYRVQPRQRVLMGREQKRTCPILQLDHTGSPEDLGEP